MLLDYDNSVDIFAVALCLYILFTTYRQKKKTLLYKISWSFPFGLGLVGAILDLSGFASSAIQEKIFKVVLYTSLVWALILSFVIYPIIRRKENEET